MVGDMDNTGSLNAQVIHQLTAAVRSKIAMQVCRLVVGTAFQVTDIVIAVSEFLFYFLRFADSAAQVCELAV